MWEGRIRHAVELTDGRVLMSAMGVSTHAFVTVLTLATGARAAVYAGVHIPVERRPEASSVITALTEFTLPEAVTRDEAKAIFLSTAPTYRGVPGLVRKCYLLSEDGRTVGGAYLWSSREAAEALYTDAWRAFVREKYGTEPKVTYFATPVVVDNALDETLSFD